MNVVSTVSFFFYAAVVCVMFVNLFTRRVLKYGGRVATQGE